MRLRAMPWTLAALLVVGAAAAQEPDREAAVANARLLAEVRALRQQARELAARKQALEARLAAAALDADTLQKRTYLAARIPVPAARIEAALREFIWTVLASAEAQRRAADDDVQVEMFRSLGPSGIPFLLDELAAMKDQHNIGAFYARIALKDLLLPEHKPYLIEAVKSQHELIDIVAERGWTEDVRELLVSELRKRPKGLDPRWIEAVASFRDPDTYGDLLWYLQNGYNPTSTCAAIKDLPGLDDDEVVRLAWERVKGMNEPWERFNVKDMVGAAARYGHTDALEMAVNALGRDPDGPQGVYNAKRIVEEVLPFAGTNEEIQKWYAEHKDELVFDKTLRRFKIEEPAP